MTVIESSVALVAEEKTQSADKLIRLISQLTKNISRLLYKLLKYFTGTTISTYFVLPTAWVFLVIFYLVFECFRIC